MGTRQLRPKRCTRASVGGQTEPVPLPHLQHFASLAGGSAEVDAGSGAGLPLQHLDALVPHLVELTPQVGLGPSGFGVCARCFAMPCLSAASAGSPCKRSCCAARLHGTLATLHRHTTPAPPPPAPQVPFYAATLARARLQRAQERLAESLRDVVERGDAWPRARVLLLLKLFATVFPASGWLQGLAAACCCAVSQIWFALPACAAQLY